MAQQFENTDGTWLALGVTGLLAAASAARGSANNGDEPLVPEIWSPDEPPPRQVPELRRRAELALPDTQLARIIMYGGDPLSELSFEQVARIDPRRIDALISQRMGRAFSEVMGVPPGPEAEQMYLMGVQFVRNNFDGDLPAAALVSLVEENLDRALFATWPRLPGPIKQHLRNSLHVFDEAIDDSVDIANRAAAATRNDPDNVEWHALADYLEGHKAMMRQALAEGLPGPAGRRGLPGRYRALPGPRGGRGNRNCGCGCHGSPNRGSRYQCPSCAGGVCRGPRF